MEWQACAWVIVMINCPCYCTRVPGLPLGQRQFPLIIYGVLFVTVAVQLDLDNFYGLFWRRLYFSLTFDNAIGARVFKMQTLKFPWRRPMKPIRTGWLIISALSCLKAGVCQTDLGSAHSDGMYLLTNKSLHLDLS